MTLSEYQKWTKETAIYPAATLAPRSVEAVMYLALGLTSEAGEIAGKVKKLYRDGTGTGTDIDGNPVPIPAIDIDLQCSDDCPFPDRELIHELGDVLWYLARMADLLGVSLEDVMQENYEKLTSRQKRGKLGGSGDAR